MDRARALQLAIKLLGMDASRGCTAEEAANAAEKLSKLSQEHNISIMDLKLEQLRGRLGTETATPGWSLDQRTLDMIDAATRPFNCEPFLHQKSVEIVGDETEVVLAKYFLDFLLVNLPMGFKAYMRAECRAGRKIGKDTYYYVRNGWYRGCCMAVKERLKEMHDQWKNSLDGDDRKKLNELIVMKKNVAIQYLKAKYPDQRKIKTRQSIHEPAVRDGFEHGRKMELARGLGESSATTRIGGRS